jgi:hypothetical protein
VAEDGGGEASGFLSGTGACRIPRTSTRPLSHSDQVRLLVNNVIPSFQHSSYACISFTIIPSQARVFGSENTQLFQVDPKIVVLVTCCERSLDTAFFLIHEHTPSRPRYSSALNNDGEARL